MTHEEAIERLKTDIYKYADFTENPNENEFWMAFDMAIKALEQQTCGDAISRKATVERLCKVAEFMNEKRDGLGSPYIMAALFIQDNKEEFPSVQPKTTACTDAVSRAAVEDAIANMNVNGESLGYAVAYDILCDLPSVNLQPETTVCEDAISRNDALKYFEEYEDTDGIKVKYVKEHLMGLPSVNPQPKTGHWIEIAQYSDGKHKIECSECGSHIFDRGHANSFNVKNKYRYCPSCGAKMVEPQESEVRE